MVGGHAAEGDIQSPHRLALFGGDFGDIPRLDLVDDLQHLSRCPTRPLGWLGRILFFDDLHFHSATPLPIDRFLNPPLEPCATPSLSLKAVSPIKAINEAWLSHEPKGERDLGGAPGASARRRCAGLWAGVMSAGHRKAPEYNRGSA